jgi:type I restriction enzyme, S subunit
MTFDGSRLHRAPAAEWPIVRMKFLIAECRNGVWGDDADGGVDDIACARVADFDRQSFRVRLPLETLRKVPPVQRANRIVRRGDLLLEKSGGGELTSVGAVVQYLGDEPAVCSNFVAVMRPTAATDARWLCYLNAHLYLTGANTKSIKQTTGIQNLDSEEYLNERVLAPSLAEQLAISQFLDRETTHIDALIEKKTRFIELLREKRHALITQAVTRGLDPNVSMKDSGVEWLAQVPTHWTVKPLKLLVKSGSSVTYGIVQPGDAQDDGVPFVQTTNISRGDFNLENLQRTTAEIAAMYPRSTLVGGEVILGIRASIGAAYLVPGHLKGANLSRGVARIDCSDALSPTYLVQFLRSSSVAAYWDLWRQGSTFNEVSIETVRELPVPVPPRAEQAEIAIKVIRDQERIDVLIDASRRSMALLSERRAALITAAVTGQIDVRAEAPEEQAEPA